MVRLTLTKHKYNKINDIKNTTLLEQIKKIQ
jgi:hypothetical protein